MEVFRFFFFFYFVSLKCDAHLGTHKKYICAGFALGKRILHSDSLSFLLSVCLCVSVSVCVLFFLLPFAESQLWLSLVFLGAFCTASVISSLPHTSLSKLILLGSGISLVFCFCSLLSACFLWNLYYAFASFFILSFHSTPTPFLLRENVAVLSLSFFSNPILQLHQWCFALNFFTSFFSIIFRVCPAVRAYKSCATLGLFGFVYSNEMSCDILCAHVISEITWRFCVFHIFQFTGSLGGGMASHLITTLKKAEVLKFKVQYNDVLN